MAKKKTSMQKHPNLKWLLAILVVVVLLFIFKMYYYKSVNNNHADYENASLTPTVSTNNWQSYEDPTNGYSIKYPENWNYQEVNIEGGAYEGGIMLGDSSIRFYKNEVTPHQTYMMARGNELLILRIITDETIKGLEESKKISQTIIAGKPAIRLSTGAYVELSASPNIILSIYSPTYPLPEMEEILNSLVVSK